MGCGSCFHSVLKVPLKALLLSLQVAVSVGIICIIYFRLTDFTWSVNPSSRELVKVSDVQCALGLTDQGTSLCNLGYAVSGISLAGTLILVSLLVRAWASAALPEEFASCDLCFYVAPWLELVLAVLGALLWVASALVLTSFNARANDNDTPRQDWRNCICVLSWVNALLFFVLALVATCSVCYTVCGSCGGKGEAAHRKKKAEELRAKRQQAREAKQQAKQQAKQAKKAKEQAPAAAAVAAAQPAPPGKDPDAAAPGKAAALDVELGPAELQQGILEELSGPTVTGGTKV